MHANVSIFAGEL